MILLDCNALCYQAHFTMNGLTKSDGTPTGIVYGFWLQVKNIVVNCNDPYLVFCWDSDKSFRMSLYPEYKANRNKKREDDPAIFEAFYQFEELYEKIIPQLGFQNNFRYDGFEADDIIASICNDCRKGSEPITIASNDQDLYQLLWGNVKMYKPSKGIFYTQNSFQNEFGITPPMWVYVKAIAGCHTDNVQGIQGVGEKTVIKYLKDQSGKKYPKIDNKESKKIIKRNWPLVCLPFEGTPHIKLNYPKMDYQKWKEFCHEYEFSKFAKDSFFRSLFSYETPNSFEFVSTKRRRKR